MKEQESAFKKKVLGQFLSGENLFGKNVALSPILKGFLEESLQAEMDGHLRGEDKGWSSGNKRNGKGTKTVQGNLGEATIETPQDRDSGFEPKAMEKPPADPGGQPGEPGHGPLWDGRRPWGHFRPYQGNVRYGGLSTQVISGITDRVIPKVKEWQSGQQGAEGVCP